MHVCMNVYIHQVGVCRAQKNCRGQKKVSDPLELVTGDWDPPDVDARNQTPSYPPQEQQAFITAELSLQPH